MQFSEHLFSILREYASEELQGTNRWKLKQMEEVKKLGKLQSILLTAWFDAQKKHGCIAPTKNQLELRSIAQAMPFIQILEVISKSDLVIRMAGSGLEQRVGHSLTGRRLSESLLDGELTKIVPKLIADMAQNPFGLRRGFRNLCPENGVSRASTYDGVTLLLPLRGANGQINMAITVDEVETGSRQIFNTMTKTASDGSARMQETLWVDFIDVGHGIPEMLTS